MYIFLFFLLSILQCFLIPLTFGVGVPDSQGFPSYDERVLLELTNRARVNPALEMTECGTDCADAACYTVQPPLYYGNGLGRSARFHSNHMYTNSYFDHPSACTLLSTLPTTWPAS